MLGLWARLLATRAEAVAVHAAALPRWRGLAHRVHVLCVLLLALVMLRRVLPPRVQALLLRPALA